MVDRGGDRGQAGGVAHAHTVDDSRSTSAAEEEMRHGVVFGGGWGMDRETARVSFDPCRLAWIVR